MTWPWYNSPHKTESNTDLLTDLARWTHCSNLALAQAKQGQRINTAYIYIYIYETKSRPESSSSLTSYGLHVHMHPGRQRGWGCKYTPSFVCLWKKRSMYVHSTCSPRMTFSERWMYNRPLGSFTFCSSSPVPNLLRARCANHCTAPDLGAPVVSFMCFGGGGGGGLLEAVGVDQNNRTTAPE